MEGVNTSFQKQLRSLFNAPLTYAIAAAFVFSTGYLLHLATRLYILRSTETQLMGRSIPLDVNEFLIRPGLSNTSVIGLFLLPLIAAQLSRHLSRRFGAVELFPTSRLLEVIGTWGGGVVTYAFMLSLSALPYAMIVALGDADRLPLVTAFFGLLLQGASLLAIATFIATQTSNTVIKGSAVFAVCILMWASDANLTGEWDAVLRKASAFSHLQSLLKGVIDSRDLIYFVSVIAVFLLLSARAMKSNATHGAARAGFYSVGLLLFAAGANYLAAHHSRSIDTTSNKLYTLSTKTAEVVGNLPADVQIRYWDRQSEFTRARDVFDRYTLLSDKIRVEYLDPERQPGGARRDGVKGYGTVIIESAGRTVQVDALSERNLTSGLLRVARGARQICVFGAIGHSTGQFTQMAERGGRRVKTFEIATLEQGEVPSECVVAVVSNAFREYSDSAVASCRRHVEHGGSLLALLGAPFAFGGARLAEQKALDQLLANWGIQPGRDLIIDKESGAIAQLLDLGPGVILVAKTDPNSILHSPESTPLAFPLSRSLQLSKGAQSVLSTEASTVAVSEVKGNEVAIRPDNSRSGPFTLAAAVTVEGRQSRGRVLVVGSADWFGPQLRATRNDTLLDTMLEWLSFDQVDIPAKAVENRRLELTDRQRKIFEWVCLWVLPLACVIAGAGVWWRTRKLSSV